MLRAMRGVFLTMMLVACGKPARRQLDLDLIKITGEGKLRTDTVGDQVQETATFVLVDAENTGTEGAVVTLAGALADGSGHPVGEFKATSLWIPAGESRTFALVDRERRARPEATAAKILVRQATIPVAPPAAYVDQVREIEDNGKLVVQGVLHNDAKRPGQIVVIGSFHAADGRPMTRPFTIQRVEPGATQAVQFVSTPGAKHGTIYVGDTAF
jgi:hypothetical protein